MKPKAKHGDIVECCFLDHVEDGGDPLEFFVWGRVDKVTPRHVEIVSWAYADRDSIPGDTNEKRWTIVSSAILSLVKLMPQNK